MPVQPPSPRSVRWTAHSRGLGHRSVSGEWGYPGRRRQCGFWLPAHHDCGLWPGPRAPFASSRTLMNSNVGVIHTNRPKVCFTGEVGENLLPKWRLGQRYKRLYMVCQGPNSSGRSRQGAPPWRIQRMPLSMRRASLDGLPRDSIRGGQTNGSRRCQRSSGILWRLMRRNAVIICIVKDLFRNRP